MPLMALKELGHDGHTVYKLVFQLQLFDLR